MLWNKNDSHVFSMELIQLRSACSSRLSLKTYRMREPLTQDMLVLLSLQLSMGLQERNILQLGAAARLYFSTTCLPRGTTGENESIDFTNITDTVYSRHVDSDIYYSMTIVNTNSNPKETDNAIKDLLDTCSEYKFTALDCRHAITLTPFHNVHVYVDDIKHNAVIFSNILSDELILKLAAIAPIIYNTKLYEPLADALLAGDKKAVDEAYCTIMKPIIDKKENEKKLNELTKFISTLNANELNTLQNNIRNTQEDIKTYTSSLEKLFTQLQELQMKQVYSKTVGNSKAAEEFLDYLKSYKMDSICAVRLPSDGVMSVLIRVPLLYFDEEVMKLYVTSSRGNDYTNSKAHIQKLLTDIFINKTYTLMIEQGVDILFNTNAVRSTNAFLTTGPISIHGKGIANPHMHYYNCWGNNKTPICKALNNKQYIEAWEQICSALSGINLTDGAVFSKFVYSLNHDSMIWSYPILLDNTTKELISINQYRERIGADNASN